MKKLLAAFAAAACAVAGARAETLAWYQFGEGAVGTAPASGQPVVLNSVDPAKWPARAYQHGNNAFDLTSSTTYIPRYAATFDREDMFVYDPVTMTREDNRTSLLFSSAAKNGYGASSVLLIDEDSDFIASRSYTIEVFFRSASDVANPACWRTLFCKDYSQFPGGVVAAEHGFRLGAEKGLAVELRFYKNKGDTALHTDYDSLTNNTVVKSVNTSGANGYNFRDGAWHHAALVVDDDNSIACVYMDYEQVGSFDYSALGHAYRAPGMFSLARTHCRGYGSLHAYIDNLRFSNEALAPDRFLRIGAREDLRNPDTVTYLSFEPTGVGRTNRVAVLVDEATYSNDVRAVVAYRPNVANSPGTMSVEQNDGATVVRDGVMRGGDGAPNAYGADFVPHPTEYYTPYFTIEDRIAGVHRVFSGSFTIETVIKMPPQILKIVSGSAKATYLMGKLMKNENGSTPGNIMVQANGTPVRNLSVDMWSRAANARVRVGACTNVFDGNRHHIAITYDRAKQVGELWVDYRLKGTNVFDYVDDIANDGDSATVFNLGGMYNNDRYGVLGAIEEFRLSKRALAPQEFLTMTPDAGPGPRARIDFDGDLCVAPYEVETPMGAASGTHSFSSGVGSRNFATATGGTGRENPACVELSGGVLRFGGNLMVEALERQTVELFAKGAGSGNLVRLARADGGAVWALRIVGGAMEVEAGGESHTIPGAGILSGAWTHFAMTIERTADGNAVSIYKNGISVGEWEVDGELDWGARGETGLVFGDSAMNVALDEFIVTDRILLPEEFTRFYRAGTVFLLR